MHDYIGQYFGNYRILRSLGAGTFAEVYLAEHRYLEMLAAIKILHLNMSSDMQDAFLKEARTIARLQHPHIIRVLDFGFERETPYLVTEYMVNGTIRSLYPKGKATTLEQILPHVKQLASALDYAHKNHIIHRDVKPENILLNTKQEIVLSDFGLAVVQSTISIHSTYLVAGTPVYMAPEQILQHPCAASDQYALGVIVYEWLCGEPPFRGTIPELFDQHLYQPPPDLLKRVPQLPTPVEDAIQGALAKDPQKRFPSMEDFASVLEDSYFVTQPLTPSETLSLEQDDISSTDTQPNIGTIISQTTQPRTTVEILTSPGGDDSLQQSSHPLKVSRAQTNRQRLLQKVRSFWISGILEHSLQKSALLALGLHTQQDALASPWKPLLHYPDTPLPVGTHITEIYDQAAGELLILGAPGSGKTTLLLVLARDLLKRAEEDDTLPIPVLFNLSTWAVKQMCLVDWFVEELASKYQVPRKIGRTLVQREQILPLVDGLDEVNAHERTACVAAINSFRQEHGLLPLVVCCRLADYQAQNVRLQLSQAVTIQALTYQQIEQYLQDGGQALDALREALRQDTELQELARTPLMLHVLMLSYHNQAPQSGAMKGSPASRRQHIFATYVERMLSYQSSQANYSKEQAISGLSYLARQMKKHSQVVFYIERMQPDWLEEERTRRQYPHQVYYATFGLLGALWLAPLGAMLLAFRSEAISPLLPRFGSPAIAVLFYLPVCIIVFGFLFGLLNALLFQQEETKKPHEGRKPRSEHFGRRLVRSFINGWLVTDILGFAYGLTLDPPDQTTLIADGILVGLLGGLVFLLIDSFLNIQTTEIRLTETFTWSWKQTGLQFLKFLLLGLLGSLLLGLILGLTYGVYLWLARGETGLQILAGVFLVVRLGIIGFGLFALCICGLLGILTGGLSKDVIAEKDLTKPNQGIRRSLLYSICIGSIGLIFGSVLGGVLGKFQDPHALIMLIYALIFGPLTGLVTALRAGGSTYMQHILLRRLLHKEQALPKDYPHFLDYTVERVFLQKVGGGYMFVHRLLLEYFASLPDSRRR